MPNTVALTFELLSLGAATSLAGLWFLFFVRRPSARNAPRLVSGLAFLLAEACAHTRLAWLEEPLRALGLICVAGSWHASRSRVELAGGVLLLGCLAAQRLEVFQPLTLISKAAGLMCLGAPGLLLHKETLRLKLELGAFYLSSTLAATTTTAAFALLAPEEIVRDQLNKTLFPLMAAILALGLGAIAAWAAKLASPIEMLSRQARPLTRAQLEGFNPLPFKTGDEIEEIAESIRVMILALQKNREDLQSQLSHLQRLDQLQQQFMANVSHELRTPLTMILGNTDILHEEILGPLNAEQKEGLQTIQEQGQLLHQLIRDVLDFAELKDNTATLHLQQVELRELSLALLKEFSPLLRHKQIKFQGKAPELKIIADADKLRKILRHLLSNAIKFSKKGGTISLRVLPKTTAPEPMTQFEIEDTGIGIPPKSLSQIFNPFYQADGSSTREHGGTGIGLTLVKHFVELHGGQVSLESEVGKGTKALFSLPLKTLPPREQPSRPTNTKASGRRVMLASDNPTVSRILKTYLVQGGFDVFSVSNLLEANKEVTKIQPALLVLEIHADEEAVWQAMSDFLYGAQGQPSLPVLAVSTRISRRDALARGARDFLELPTDFSTFISMVKTIAAEAR